MVKTGNLVFQHGLSGYRPRFNEKLAISNEQWEEFWRTMLTKGAMAVQDGGAQFARRCEKRRPHEGEGSRMRQGI
jgi:hypothetical protein